MASTRYYPRLNPLTALQLLAGIVQRDAAVGLLTRLDGRIEWPAGVLRPDVTLRLAPPKSKLRRGDQEAERHFDEEYEALTHNEGGLATDRSDLPYVPLLGLLPHLVLHSDPEGNVALIDENVRLIVARDLADDEAAEVLERLNLFGAPVRVAARTAPEGVKYHYYLANQAAQQALDAWGAGRPEKCSVPLTCRYVEINGVRQRVFLPRDGGGAEETERAVSRIALEYAVVFLLGAGNPLGLGEPLREPEAVAAITTVESDDWASLHYLANLPFVDRDVMRPVHDELAGLEIVAGDGSELAQQRLQEAMDRLEPQVGYRLELRQAFWKAADEGAYEAAVRRRDEATYEKLLIESLHDDPRRPRPVLLRFTAAQLPHLADVLRSYRMEDLRYLLYAFQADSARYPEGVHYLYADPALLRDERDPLVYWAGQVDQPLRFWIDPYWALSYYQGEQAAQVFVPYGYVLFPTLHSLRDEDDEGGDVLGMNRYLERVLTRTAQASAGVETPPSNRAVYVFDGQPGRQLEVYVLDMAAFQPLTVRLDWLNDCLSVMGQVGVAEYVQEMSTNERRARLAERFRRAEQTAVQAYTVAQECAEQTMAGYSAELLTSLTSELATLASRADDLGKKAGDLNVRLRRLEVDYDEMQRLAARTESLRERAMAGADDLNAFSDGLVRKVETSLRDSELTRTRLQQQLATDVEQLSNTHEELRETLARLRRLLE